MYDQYDQHPEHFYIEPISAVTALIEAEPFEGTIYDPACGSGTIPRTFRSRGFKVMSSDVVQRFHGADIDNLNFRPFDFLRHDYPVRVANVVSNPPYKLAEEFLFKALDVANCKVAFLLRLAFLEGRGRADRVFNGKTPLARVHVFPNRVNMPPGHLLQSGAVKREGGKHAYGWFVWDHAHKGDATVKWLNPNSPQQ